MAKFTKFCNVAIMLILLVYIGFMTISISREVLSVHAGTWVTISTLVAIVLLIICPRLISMIHRKLYQNIRRMMK